MSLLTFRLDSPTKEKRFWWKKTSQMNTCSPYLLTHHGLQILLITWLQVHSCNIYHQKSVKGLFDRAQHILESKDISFVLVKIILSDAVFEKTKCMTS